MNQIDLRGTAIKLTLKAASEITALMDRLKNKLMTPQIALLNIATMGMIASRAVYIAAELGLADLLKERAMSIEEMASVSGVHARSLYRVMRILVSSGLFVERKDHRYKLTSLGEYLRSDIPGSVRAMVLFTGAGWHWDLWGNMLDSVRTGKPACENLYGEQFFEWIAREPEQERIFNEAMTNLSEMVNLLVVSGYDFSSIGTLADIGGGYGGLLASILRANPAMKGILFELANTLEGAREKPFWKGDGLLPRCDFISGNFFESIPSGADAYIMKSIIHDWNDQDALQILRNCRRAIMKRGKKILLVEMVISNNHDLFNVPKFLDVGMLILSGGCERTRAEYQALFEATGFKLSRVISTASASSIIEGVSV